MRTTRAATSRRRSRGSALVETVIIMPALLLLFASLVYVWKLYLAKMAVMEAARGKAWSSASANCQDTPATEKLPIGLPQVPTDPVNGAAATAHVDAVAKQDLGSTTATAGDQLTASSLLGGFTSRVAAQTSVMCNEPPYNGRLPQMIVAAVHDLTKWP
jgi:Flp pilus assembly protein TadG